MGHAWNIVKVEGEYYHLDTTWGDPVYEDGHQERLYDYFLVTSETIHHDHTENFLGQRFPECTATEYNYYVQNGRYLPGYDEGWIQSLIAPIIFSGEKTEFRFADQASFQAAQTELFDNGRIWDLVRNQAGDNLGSGTVYHTVNDAVYTMTIWFVWD